MSLKQITDDLQAIYEAVDALPEAVSYSAGDGISISGTTIHNSGVRAVETGASAGTISVNTDGEVTNVKVKGILGAAFKSVDYFAPAYTYGTEDLVAGTSELATGKLYFVYE